MDLIQEWLMAVKSKGHLTPTALSCLRVLATRIVGDPRPIPRVNSALDLYHRLKEDDFCGGSPEKALRVIVHLMSVCNLSECLKMLEEFDIARPDPLLPSQLSEEARFAQLLVSVYCAMIDGEKQTFKNKLAGLSGKRSVGSVGELFHFVVSNHWQNTELVKEAVESVTLHSKTTERISKVFVENNMELIPNPAVAAPTPPYLQQSHHTEQVTKPAGCTSKRCILVMIAVIMAVIGVAGVIFIPIKRTTLIHQHASFSSTATVQIGLVTVALTVDPYWYRQAEASKTDDALVVQLNATLVSSTSLVPHYTSSNWSSGNFFTDTNSNRQLTALVDYSYLVRGSSVTVKVNILSSRSPPTLYLLDNWADYNKYATSGIPSQFVAAYPISNTGNTTHNITIKNTGFYFFLIHFPSKTYFWYQFWVVRLYYHADDYTFTCATTSSEQPCRFSLDTPSSTSEQFLLVLPIGLGSGAFTSINTNVENRPFNSLTTSLLVLTVVAAVLVLAAMLPVLVYLIVKAMKRVCSRREHGGDYSTMT